MTGKMLRDVVTISILGIWCCAAYLMAEEQRNHTQIDYALTGSIHNLAAYVPSQCYTKTQDDTGHIHNPCFTCHRSSKEPNYIHDAYLQGVYDFSDYTKVNRFTNLFKDRTEAVAKISDDEILYYIRKNNYQDREGKLVLAQKLHTVPKTWDINQNGKWDGYIPDCYFSFDTEGFDRDPSGTFTGWRAFAYHPFPGTFWPTNGSTDDVLIRLPEVFREDRNGEENLTIYKVNLAIVESLIKEEDIALEQVDEKALGIDLDQDGRLGISTKVKFRWLQPSYDVKRKKLKNFSMQYVGRANKLLQSNEQLIAPGLYPKGTEFLHTIRYIDIDESKTTIKMAARMKELRYAKKTHWNSYAQMQNAVISEIKERDQFPDRLRNIVGNTEEGLGTGLGWTYQGFIEDAAGDLRPQNYEETQFCIGCHSGIGAITDSTFAYPRKFEKNSWYHWSQRINGLKGIPELRTRDGRGEYRLYLEVNHAGDEFRANEEVMKKFFDDNGVLIAEEAEKIKEDISYLLYPSAKRALELNKVYKVIVDEQSYIYGRDAHVKPVKNVHETLQTGQSTGVSRIIE